MAELEYVKTDRNGTKYFNDWVCPRCGGAGESDKWLFTGRICYGCGGTGKRHTPKIVKEYTEAYAQKLEQRRRARMAKREAENPPPSPAELLKMAEDIKINSWENQGFDREGNGFFYSGNTYQHRSEISNAGARWSQFLHGYIAPENLEGLKGVTLTEIKAQDVCNDRGLIDMDKALYWKETNT